MPAQILSYWLEKLHRIIEEIDRFQHLEQLTPQFWTLYGELESDIHKLQSFLSYEQGYLAGKVLELGSSLPSVSSPQPLPGPAISSDSEDVSPLRNSDQPEQRAFRLTKLLSTSLTAEATEASDVLTLSKNL